MFYKTACVFILLIFLTGVVKNEENDGNKAQTPPQKTFKEAEKEILAFINEQLRALLPKVVGGGGSSTLSQKCVAGMMKIFGNIRHLKGWTVKFLDSIGKPTAGILAGTSYSLGHYDQCIDLSVTSRGIETQNVSEAMFQGMYCKVRIKFADTVAETARSYHQGQLNASDLGKLKEIIQATPYIPLTSEYMSHFIGICLPSSCTVNDVQQLLQAISFPGSTMVERCEVKTEKEWNSTQLTALILFLVLICFICVSTFMDWVMHNRIRDEGDRRCVSVTVAFSFCNNTKQLMRNIEDDADSSLSGHCVRGIVVASVAWIVLGHTYLLPYDAFYMQASSLENLQKYLSEAYFSFVVSYPLALDALFTCYGFILTYTLWYSACRPEDVKVKVFQLIICNYLRICIPVLFCLGIVFLLPTIGSGPFWKDLMDDIITRCNNNSGAYFGMFSNFLSEEEQCLPHLWFSSCLAQITLVGIILSWVLSRNMKFGIVIAVLLTLAGNITVGVYTYNNELFPAYLAYFTDRSDIFWKMNYSLPLSRFGPFAVGMLTGIFVSRRSSHRIKPCLSAVGWLVCICVLGGVILFSYEYYLDPMNNFVTSVYAGSHRTLFAVGIAWVIIACSFGNGGFVNAILSWRVFDPLFRLSYYVYIMHFVIITFMTGVSREHFYYSHQELIFRALSYIAASYVVSYLLYMMLERPLKSLSRALCPKRSSQIDVTSLNNIDFNKSNILIPNSSINGSCKLWSVSNKNSVSY